jgi:hypothetical protein
MYNFFNSNLHDLCLYSIYPMVHSIRHVLMHNFYSITPMISVAPFSGVQMENSTRHVLMRNFYIITPMISVAPFSGVQMENSTSHVLMCNFYIVTPMMSVAPFSGVQMENSGVMLPKFCSSSCLVINTCSVTLR